MVGRERVFSTRVTFFMENTQMSQAEAIRQLREKREHEERKDKNTVVKAGVKLADILGMGFQIGGVYAR